MKFTHSLKFNSVPEWGRFYVNYNGLKKTLYKLSEEPAEQSQHDEEQGLEAPLLGELSREHSKRHVDFKAMLETELSKVVTFFHQKEQELSARAEQLEMEITAIEGSAATNLPLHNQTLERRLQFWKTPQQKAARDNIKLNLTDLYIQLKGLEDFITLNREGFRKIVKKHDKVNTNCPPLKDQFNYESELRQLGPREDEGLAKALKKVVDLYSTVIADGERQRAEASLKKHLRDHVTYERNTVWRDMISLERRSTAAQVQGSEGNQPAWYLRYWQPMWLIISVAVLVLFLNIKTPFDDPVKQNCLAMMVFVSLLWCTEALPLFVTSMLLPLLVVMLGVMQDKTVTPPRRLPAMEAAPAVFHAMFSQVIMLLLGGFAIAAALSKHFIAKQMAVAVLSRVGRRPSNVLLASMMVATFASMWISNVASPVLCFSLVQPILRTLSPSNTFAKALVMGIAMASNIGGMSSPISSPQNIFAIERMSMGGDPPSWLQWFAVALPVSLVGNVGCWLVLRLVYRPDSAVKEVRPLKPSTDPVSGTQVFVVVISLLTVALWCCNSMLQRWVGEMGVIAILPLVAFFGFGVLNKDDFNAFLWNVVMLAMGGLALGEAVKSSGLLQAIAEVVQEMVAGYGLYTVLTIFCALVLVCTTFISHTVGAMVILPILQVVGEHIGTHPHPKLLVMAAALMCSGAMGLPVSGFPNMTAVALEDGAGVNYVGLVDFLKVGITGSLIAYVTVISLGYVLMLLVGF